MVQKIAVSLSSPNKSRKLNLSSYMEQRLCTCPDLKKHTQNFMGF